MGAQPNGHLAPHRKLRLISRLKFHAIDDRFFWIAPERGYFMALDQEEHRAFALLHAGFTPLESLERLADNTAEAAIIKRWEVIRRVIAKAVHWGFVSGLPGAVYPARLQPERFARFHITQRCQLACIHCYSGSGPGCHGGKELPTERLTGLLEEFARNGGASVLFTGGEPLVRSDCPTLFTTAKENGLTVRALTNGLLVPKYLRVLTDAVDSIQVSLGSPEEKSNDDIRGPGTFRKIVEALDLLVQTPLEVQVGITAMGENWGLLKEELPRFAERYRGAGLKFHVGMGVCRHGRGFDLGDDLDLEKERFDILALVDQVNGISATKVFSESVSCGYCEQLVIGPDGHIFPCHLLEGAIGHVDDMPLRLFFPRLRAIAKRHRVGHLSTCKICDIRKACGGTCRVINEKLTGSRFTPTCSENNRLEKIKNLIAWSTS